jgi:aerobic C4-dicarboxylate transport protein
LSSPSSRGEPVYRSLYVQVLIGIALGIILGYAAPSTGEAMRPLGDGFIKLIKMLIGPIVFSTVVVGLARMGAMKQAGRIGWRAFVYFEIVSTLALVIGLIVVSIVKPGVGLQIDASKLDASAVSAYANQSHELTTVGFLLNIIPTSFVSAFAQGEILQVLLVSVLFGLALLSLGDRGRPLVDLIEQISHTFFAIVSLIMRLAPIGAFGAMAFTVGKYGVGTLLSLGKLMAAVYITCALFICVVLGGIAAMTGFSLWKLLRYLREELVIVLGTSSSESALPTLMEKLEKAGVPRDQLAVLGILLLTSKGAAGVTGSGFVTLAATLSAIPSIPIAGLALLLGVDRFMSEARAITNLIGNAVATLAVARWTGTLDTVQVGRTLDGETTAHTSHASAAAAASVPVGAPQSSDAAS